MKVHPFVAAAVLLLAGVTALGATAVVQQRRARARRPPPPLELDESPPAPRHIYPMVELPRLRPAPPPAAPARGELHVHVAGPHGLLVSGIDVSVHRRGDPPDAWDLLSYEVDDAAAGEAREDDTLGWHGMLSSTDLAPGRYDLRVEAEGMRPVHLDDVPSGPKVVEVALARAPVLLGDAGAMGALGCANMTVAWAGPEEEGLTGEATVDESDCTFAIEGLPTAGPLTITATVGKVQRRAFVTLPLSGDPTFLCLEPPCSAEPATLLVYVADGNQHEVDDATLTWTLRGDELHGAMGTSMGFGLLFVHGRRVGETLDLRAERGEQIVDTTTTLGPGVTEVLLTFPACPRPSYDRDDDVAAGDDDDDQ
jgi:hypothetical protein